MTEHKDILSKLAETYWTWLEDFCPEFRMLLVRWALLLLILLLLGLLIRFLLARTTRRTLVAQVAAGVLAVLGGLTIPLDGLEAMRGSSVTRLLNLSVIAWAFLPLCLPSVLVRTRGFQHLARIGLYVIEASLILIQWLVLKGE